MCTHHTVIVSFYINVNAKTGVFVVKRYAVYARPTNGGTQYARPKKVGRAVREGGVTLMGMDCGIKVVIHVEMPKAAPKKSICHFQKLEMILK